MVSLIEEAYIKVRNAKRLIVSVFSLFALGFITNAGHALEVINAPTVGVDNVEKHIEQTNNAAFSNINGEEIYEGPGLEIPNFIDVIKEKVQQGGQEVITPEEAAQKSKADNVQKQSLTLDADEMEYFEDRNEIEARGHVFIKTYPDGTTLNADKAIFNRDTNIIKLFDNVVLNKDDSTLKGDFMSINLNEENVLMNEPTGNMGMMTLRAQEGYAYANEIQMLNGDAKLAKEVDLTLHSKGFGYLDQTIVQEEFATPELRKKRSEPLKIKTKEIIIESKRDHDTITFKHADIYYKKFKIATAESAEILTDKGQGYVETNLPEVGMIRDFGTYFGWGYATEVPFGGTLKVMPAIVYDSGLGIGGIARYRSKRNFIEAAYATSSENFIVRGKYEFNKNLYIDYGRHAYFDEWFYGRRQPGYIAQLVYDKNYRVKDLNAIFKHRISAGYVTDYGVQESDSKFGTSRFRYQAELSKMIFERKNDEQDMYIRGHLYAQGGATLYGTGDVTGIVRFGPSLHTRVKNWGSRISYGMAGVHGRSPLMFDTYIYGKQFLTIDENIRLGKYLALGYQGTISLLRDNPGKDLLTENKFYVVAGPEDIKVAFSYDTYRERALFDVLFYVGKDNSKIEYDKLTIKNPDKVGKETSPFENLKYYRVKVPENI